jgi:hypothetical protein
MSLQCGCATRLHISPVYIPVLLAHNPIEFQTATRDPMPSRRGCEGKDARHAGESVDFHRSAVASARASPRQAAQFFEIDAVIVHFSDDRVAERTTLVPRPCHPHQILERKVVASQTIYRTDQAKALGTQQSQTLTDVPEAAWCSQARRHGDIA